MVGALVHGYLVEFFRRMECQKPLRVEASGVEGFVFGSTTLPNRALAADPALPIRRCARGAAGEPLLSGGINCWQ
jgi:hypothetical protein